MIPSDAECRSRAGRCERGCCPLRGASTGVKPSISGNTARKKDKQHKRTPGALSEGRVRTFTFCDPIISLQVHHFTVIQKFNCRVIRVLPFREFRFLVFRRKKNGKRNHTHTIFALFFLFYHLAPLAIFFQNINQICGLSQQTPDNSNHNRSRGG